MMVLFVSEGCGRCEGLKKRLIKNGFKFTISEDINFLIEKGYQNAPVLQINGTLYDMKASMDLLKDFEHGKGMLTELIKEQNNL